MPRGSIVVIWHSLCLGLISCDLFKTRTPAEPSQQSSNYVPPTDVGLVLQNMINAFHDGNAVNYAKSFTDLSFEFEAAPGARVRYGDELTNWDKMKEQKYFENVIQHTDQNSDVVLEFESYTPNPINDSSQVGTNYHLTVYPFRRGKKI